MVMKKRQKNRLIESSSLSSIIDQLEINSQPGNSIADDNENDNSQIAYYDMVKIFKKVYLFNKKLLPIGPDSEEIYKQTAEIMKGSRISKYHEN